MIKFIKKINKILTTVVLFYICRAMGLTMWENARLEYLSKYSHFDFEKLRMVFLYTFKSGYLYKLNSKKALNILTMAIDYADKYAVDLDTAVYRVYGFKILEHAYAKYITYGNSK